MKLGSKLWSLIGRVARSRFLTSIPLFTFLFFSAINFLVFLRLGQGFAAQPLYWVNTGFVDSRTLEAANIAAGFAKQKYQFAGYGLSLLLIMFRLRQFFRFWFREVTLLTIFVVLLLTTVVSDNPDRVVTNLVHLVFGVVAVWLYFSHDTRRADPVRAAALCMLYSIGLVQLLSFIWFLGHPEGSIEAIVGGKRLGGLAGNPNTFGGVCVVATWAVCTLIFTQQNHNRKSWLWLFPVGIVAFNSWSTGSATTLASVSIVVVLFIINRAFRSLNRKRQSILIIVATGIVFSLGLWLVVQQNLLGLAESATDSVGKDLTLTGRVDLWALALEAIAERPLLGWSYDNHETIKAEPLYEIRYNHFHNGFLDTLIVGGALFGFAVLANFYAFYSRARKIGKQGVYIFPLFIGVFAACMQNLTEYSMFRSITPVWMMYTVCFVSVAIQFNGLENTIDRFRSGGGSGKSKGKRRRSKGTGATPRYYIR